MLTQSQHYLLSHQTQWLHEFRTLVFAHEDEDDETYITMLYQLYQLEKAFPATTEHPESPHLLTILQELHTLSTMAPTKKIRAKAYKHLLTLASREAKRVGKVTIADLGGMEQLPRYDHMEKQQLEHALRKVQLEC